LEKVLFTDKEGPWFHLESLRNTQYGRWVHHNDDTDFTIVEKIEVKDD
jgi:hypothetical protein